MERADERLNTGKNGWMEKLFAFCRTAALALMAAILVPIAAASFFVMAKSYGDNTAISQIVLLEGQSLPQTLLLTAVMLVGLLLASYLLTRMERMHMGGVLMLLWTAAALLWAWAVRCGQRADAQTLLVTASQFAQGDYTLLGEPYLQGVSYQLGFCLLLEAAFRFLPGADIASVTLLVQCANALLSLAAAGMLVALADVLAGNGKGLANRHACVALYLLFLPMLLFCIYAYSVLPMVFCCAGSFLCFALYVRTRRTRFGLAYALLLGLAALVKPNTMIVVAALAVCALMDALHSADARPLAFAVLAVALAVLFPRMVIWQYEWRSGIEIGENVSMLARLAMGVQDAHIAPGWYNGYIDEYVESFVPIAQQEQRALADLSARLSEWAQNPLAAAVYLRDKCLTQWLEPSYETVWYGNIVQKTGQFNGLGYLVYREDSAVNALLLVFMGAYQRAMYLLAIAGAVRTLRQRGDAATLILPVTVLGGFLYHMLFEAKAQYIYVYVFYMMPLAAQGLCAVEDAVRRVFIRRKKAA